MRLQLSPRRHANIFLPADPGRKGVAGLPAVRIITSGRVRNRFAAEGIQEYVKRISPFARIDIVENAGRGRRKAGPAQIKLKEGELAIALDAGGEQVTSEDLSRILAERDRVAFLIGGPEGLPPEALGSSHARVSLSRMTFTSELAELILVEQIYRAFMILNNRPYHK